MLGSLATRITEAAVQITGTAAREERVVRARGVLAAHVPADDGTPCQGGWVSPALKEGVPLSAGRLEGLAVA